MATNQAPLHFTKTSATSHTKHITIGRDDWSETTGRFYEQAESNPKGRSALMVMYKDTFSSEQTSPHMYYGNSAAAPARMCIWLNGGEKWTEHVSELEAYQGKMVRLDFRKSSQSGRWKALLLPLPSIRITAHETSPAQSAWNDFRASQFPAPGSILPLRNPPPTPTRRAVSINKLFGE